MSKIKKIAAGVATAVAALALSLAGAVPANAAGIPNTAVPGTEANTYISETKTVTDGGGHQFSIKVLWTETYKTAAGNYRVGVKVFINAKDIDLDTDGPGDGGMDAKVQTFQGYADGHVKLIQTKTYDGASDPLTVDNANPLNRPGGSKVVASAGYNDDGHPNSLPVTFVQPVVGDEDPGADGEGIEAP